MMQKVAFGFFWLVLFSLDNQVNKDLKIDNVGDGLRK